MTPSKSSARAGLLGWAVVALAACGADEAPAETGVVVIVDPEDTSRVARIAVRVWDSELRLAADHFAAIGANDRAELEVSLPWRIPLRPAGGALGRWFRIEIDLLDGAWCPYARAQASAAYEHDVVVELRPRFEPLPTATCRAVFVDPTAAGAADDPTACTDPSTPCISLEQAIRDYATGADPTVVYARGAHDYSERDPGRALLARSTGAPLVLRPWPGTGMPLVDAAAESDTAIDNCCSDDASPGLVVDGFELTGGVRWGVAFNGAGGTGGVVRNCWIHQNGQPVQSSFMMLDAADRPLDAGVMSINGPDDLTIEHNLIEMNGVGVSTAWGIHLHHTHGHVVRGNRIVGNDGGGVRRWDDTMSDVPLVVRDNVLCDNGGNAVDVAEVSSIEHNSIVGNDGAAFILRGPRATVRDNIVVGNEGGVYDSAGTVPAEGDSFIHANGEDGRYDGDPRFADAAGCLLTLLPDSPARGTASDGSDPGAF